MATMKFQVQVSGEFGGSVDGWRPGCAGTENQTGTSDAEASTFDTHDAAEAYADHLRSLCADPRDDESGHASPRDEVRFRVVTL